MSKLKIRDARPEDLEPIARVFLSHKPNHDWKYAKKYFNYYFGSLWLHTKNKVLVGVVKGRVIGVIGYFQDEFETDDIFWLGWFYVHTDARGKSYGKELLRQVIHDVKKRGARKLFTDTSSWGFYGRAHHRYRAYGFKAEAKLKDYYEKGEHQVIYGMNLK